ncbi:uncharacterized protein [Miscanthus floridulus]|uniref:uncharacterized protein n=1 Tax=Miscanthus floridulus TaxID=154761 RepID=UPI00345AC470
MVDLIVDTKRLTKVLMDGGNGLNIMYAEMLDAMGIDRSRIWPTRAPFHGIVPRKQVMSLGQIDLLVTFGNPTNYRMETLTFEVVGFHVTYHAILGHPRYAKFMVVLNYTYLKLKMSSPKGVITVEDNFEQAYHCEQDYVTQAAMLVTPCAPDSPGRDAGRASVRKQPR